jgi:hypothetical protein
VNATCEAALIWISGFPLYISIRPVIFTCLPSIPDSIGDLFTGDVGGIQPVKVWLEYVAPIFRNMFPALLVNTFATTPSTVCVFAHVRCCFVGQNDSCGLGSGDGKNRL